MTQEIDSPTTVTSVDSNDEVNQFRKVLPAAYECRGRSLPQILYDRSIKGPFASGGRRRTSVIDEHSSTRNSNSNSNNNSNSNSPSSVASPRLKMNDYPTHITHEIRNYGEQRSVTKFTWKYLGLRRPEMETVNTNNTSANQSMEESIPRRLNTNNNTNSVASATSTISVAFSPDGRTVASTHGDHTVKIICCHSGALIRSLEGHPRTPWTVKYHPTKSNIVASGCLGCQVLVWDWNYKRISIVSKYRNELNGGRGTDKTATTRGEEKEFNYSDGEGKCLNMIRLQSAIISLSFHPSGSILAVASGTTLHLWDYDENGSTPRETREDNNGRGSRSAFGRGTLTEIQHEDNLRLHQFVHVYRK